jgi:hypothetical protein
VFCAVVNVGCSQDEGRLLYIMYITWYSCKGAYRRCLFSCISPCNIACAVACVTAQESCVSCSLPSPVQTLLTGQCSLSFETLHCVAVTAIIDHKKKRYRKRWMSSFLEKRNQNLNILGEVRMDNCALFRNFTMTASDFELLLQTGRLVSRLRSYHSVCT